MTDDSCISKLFQPIKSQDMVKKGARRCNVFCEKDTLGIGTLLRAYGLKFMETW